MRVYISSESPVKHAAVRLAFGRFSYEVETVSKPMASNVNEQPVSLDETYEGAINRHEQLARELKDELGDDYLVTIESGIFTPRPEHNFFGTTTLVVENANERRVGIDVDIEIPKHMTDRVPTEYKDLGELVTKEYGASTKDPFPHFTNGKVTREQIISDALYRVLAQFKELNITPKEYA